MSNWTTGLSAEEVAANFLRKNGYKVLERNFRIRGGEIDIVARDQNDLVFVVVKARWSHKYGLPIESVTPWKLKTLFKTALFYIQNIKWGDKPYRFDVISIDYADDRKSPQIELFKNITS